MECGEVGIGRAGDAEVEDFGLAGVIDNYVCGFKVAVDHAVLVGVLHRAADSDEERHTVAGA